MGAFASAYYFGLGRKEKVAGVWYAVSLPEASGDF